MPASNSATRSWVSTLHALTALFLMVLFFVAAAAASVGLVYLGYHLGLGAIGTIRGKGLVIAVLVALAMVAAGLIVAWSLLPRFDRFEAPGPELHRDQHPALHREIDRVATLSGEQGPRHVYLVGDVNAFVAERGGLMGLGSRRIMGLGLPLLNVLTVSELRAVLAHEFGHYAGGDTSFGRWIHGTRLALIRTLQNLGSTAEAASELGSVALVFAAIHAPFRWFFHFYMRFTQALSRRQEFDADALAVHLESTPALTLGLTKVRKASAAYDAFVQGELAPLVSEGYLPPVGQGFRQFMQAETVAPQVEQLISRALESGESADPYDSHPPLAERIAAAQKLNRPPRSTDARLGIELLNDVPLFEKLVAQAWVDSEKSLKTIEWEDSAAPIEKQHRARAAKMARLFEGLTLKWLPQTPAGLRSWAERQFTKEQVANSDDDTIIGWAVETFGSMLLVLFLEQGFRLLNRPGRPLAVSRGDDEFEPQAMIRKFLEQQFTVESWGAQLQALNIGDTDLGSLAT